MNAMTVWELIGFSARVILGMVFVIAGMEKIAMPEAFAVSVEAYRMMPLALVNVFALIVPWVEVLSGIFLLAGSMTRASAALASAMLVMFLAAILAAMARDLEIECGCFGDINDARVGWSKILENGGLLALGIYLMVRPRSVFAAENHLLNVTSEGKE